ncbi:MAG: hypothetical protein VX515_02490 [Candidatus Thermoplasmatota archaeon]|nr:hypothetical protein [Candidatus Thermoplasmatota archaeon]
MSRVRYPVVALLASFVCVVSFAVSYSNFDGYGDLDPEQNSLKKIESGGSFSIVLDEYDQIWVYSENRESSNASVKITLNGAIVNGTSAKWYDTFLTSEDGERVYVPLIKLGPGAEGEYVFENDGVGLLYLIDMVGIGENLWEQSSVQIMAVSCCLSPLLAMIGVFGLIRSPKTSKIGPKILVFDSNVGIPTTEEVFRSVNNIPKESVTETTTPDPWKEVSSEVEEANEELDDSTESTQPDNAGRDWQTWDEG